MICAACRATRRPDDLLAFWPAGDPGRLRYVCRPTSRPSGVLMAKPCFAIAVGPRARHEIGLASAAPLPALRLVEGPVRPFTPAWSELMAAAGVRAA